MLRRLFLASLAAAAPLLHGLPPQTKKKTEPGLRIKLSRDLSSSLPYKLQVSGDPEVVGQVHTTWRKACLGFGRTELKHFSDESAESDTTWVYWITANRIESPWSLFSVALESPFSAFELAVQREVDRLPKQGFLAYLLTEEEFTVYVSTLCVTKTGDILWEP